MLREWLLGLGRFIKNHPTKRSNTQRIQFIELPRLFSLFIDVLFGHSVCYENLMHIASSRLLRYRPNNWALSHR